MPRSRRHAKIDIENLEGAESAESGESPDSSGSDAGPVAESRIEELERQVEQEHNLYLRTLADFQNFRRRQEEEVRQIRQFANRELILGLLPVLDNFERALAAAEQSQSYEALVGGVSLTLRQMQDFLKKNGVEAIDAVGKEFDPNFHEAVMRVEDGEHPENTVVEEVQRGYSLGDRVLRPSMVKVATRS
jgi:molecular chaperone GrpE